MATTKGAQFICHRTDEIQSWPGSSLPLFHLFVVLVACLLLLLLATRHTLSRSSPQLKGYWAGGKGAGKGAGKQLEIKERKRVQLTTDIFLCAQAALMQIVEIFSTDQQLSSPRSALPTPTPPQPTDPSNRRPVHLSCCCDWFCLMELERGNNFIELDFNVRQKARYFLISFSLLRLPLPLFLSLSLSWPVHNSLVIKRDTCFKHVPDSGSLLRM